MSDTHGPSDQQPRTEQPVTQLPHWALEPDAESEGQEEMTLLRESDPAAHEAPPVRGSARYTAILEAAMNQTTTSKTPATDPLTTPTTVIPKTVTAGPDGPQTAAGDDLAQRRARRGPRRISVRRAVMATSAAAGLALAATIGINALPGATSTAYAAYTPVPTQPSPSAAIAQADACAASWDTGVPAGGFTAADVLLAEQRGPASITLVRKGADVALCQDIDPRTPTGWELLSPLAAVPADQAVIDSIGSVGEGQYAYSSTAGQLGAGVTGIDVVLPDGTVVQASTAEGRWVAWWPGLSGGEVDAVRVVVRTGGGEQRFTPTQLYADPA